MINNELQKALNELKGIRSSDVEEVVEKREEEVEVEEKEKEEAIDAKAKITISRNSMVARLKLEAPRGVGRAIDLEMIEKAMLEEGIVKGVNREYLNRLVSFSVYDKSFIIAEGKPAENGVNEYVELLIDLKDDLTPTISEDGTTDYKNLGYHKSVQPNDKLGKICRATKGEAGYDIKGNEVPAVEGKELARTPAGANTMIDTDNETIIATTAGNVYFKKNVIEVRHEKVVRNVDSSTGNINFEGDVKVLNDIYEGFSVKCKGNIKVAGVVENALLISGGDIIVAKGIHGEGCRVYAEGGIRTVHIESANLHCKGPIYADYTLNGNIISDDEIHLEGEHGYIVGGSAIATNKIEVDVVGNEVNMLTTVEVLSSHTVDPEMEELSKKAEYYTREIDKLTRAWQNISKIEMSIEERKEYTERIVQIRKQHTNELESVTAMYNKLEKEKSKEEEIESMIEVRKKVHTNVVIKINGVETKTKRSKTKCKIVVEEGRIEYTT